jgi:WG containing repeat
MKLLTTIYFFILSATVLAQNPDHWETYAQDQLRYPVVSAENRALLTTFVGIQIDAALTNNWRRGFILHQAGFRKDAITGEVRCFEAVFTDGTRASYPLYEEALPERQKIAVELIAFDTRSPQQRMATYQSVFYNISFDQERGLFRCQIPVTAPVNEHSAFVLVAQPPYLTAGISSYKEISETKYEEGPWMTNPSKPVFVYPKDFAPKKIQPSKNDREWEPLKSGYVYNDYAYPVPEKHYEWSKKGSNYARSYQENGKKGMKANDGTVLIPAEYDDIHFGFSGFMIAQKGGKTGVVNEANTVVLPFEYERLEILYRNNVSAVPSGVSLDDLRLLARKPNDQVGIINGRGKVLFPFRSCRSAEVVCFYDAPRHENLGIILSYPHNYKKLMRQTAIILNCDEGFGVVSANGATVLPFEYREISSVLFSHNAKWVVALKGDKIGLYDLNGKWVLEPKYDDGFGLFGNLNMPENRDLSNLIRARFTPPPVGDEYPVSATGIVDTLGKTLLPFEYDALATTFMIAGKRHFTAQKMGRWGVIDADNQVKIPFQHPLFVQRYEFNGQTYFSLKDSTNKYYGMLSMDNKLVIPFKYTYFADGNGKLLVVLDGKYQNGLVNVHGQVVLPLEYTNISLLEHNHFYIQKGELGGIADPEGKVVIPPTYRGLYGKEYLGAFQSFFEQKGILAAQVVAILTNDTTAFAYLKDGRLVGLD